MAKSKKGRKSYYLYGTHACEAALKNDARDIIRMMGTRQAIERFAKLGNNVPTEAVDARALEKIVPKDAVHQGITLEVAHLEALDIEDIIREKKPLLMLDQVTDPHNVGAILRSAAAFGVAGVIVPKDHAPQEGGVMGKAACGALDMVPLVTVTNLAHTIAELRDAGYWMAGLDGSTDKPISLAKDYFPLCLVMGAEGKGLRRLTADLCDVLLKIPMDNRMESLNVSNAAAIALYEVFSATTR